MKFSPQRLMIILFAIIILAVPAATIILPKQERSENENRTLATFPHLFNETKLKKAQNPAEVIAAIRWDDITNRSGSSLMNKFEDYFSDHIVLREAWVVASNTLERLSGKQQINGVLTLDDRMIQVFSEYDKESAAASLEAMSGFAAKHPNVPAAIMIAPTAQEIFSSQLPSYEKFISEKAFIDECYSQVKGMATIDCLSHLLGHSGEYIYYRTDHHWTSLGAYYAYSAAAKSLGYSAYGLSMFNIESVSSDFRGTLYSKTLDKSITPDLIDYYFLASGEPSVTVTVNDGSGDKTYDSLYFRDYLSTKDKYASFTGPNAPIVTIESDVAGGKSLLVIKDSYAHSLVPFLSKHYEKITMVDMRYINVGLEYFIDIDSYSQMLFMYNVTSIADDPNIVKLAFSS